MKRLQKTIFWIHLIIGLAATVNIALLALTGLLMSVEHPLIEWAEGGKLSSPTNGESAMPIEDLFQAAYVVEPNVAVSGLTIENDVTQPVTIHLGKEDVLLLNGYTGQKVGSGAPRLRYFFNTVLHLHRSLALEGIGREFGRNATRFATIGLILLAASGLWIWLPRKWRWSSFRPVLLLNWRLTGKPRNWNWHNVFGFWSLVPVAAIALTGVIIGYSWANDLLYRAFGEQASLGTHDHSDHEEERGPKHEQGQASNKDEKKEPLHDGLGDGVERRHPGHEEHSPIHRWGQRPRPEGPPEVGGFNRIFATACETCPHWESMSISLDGKASGEGHDMELDKAGDDYSRNAVTVVAVSGNPHVPFNRTTMYFNRSTSALLNSKSYEDLTPAQQARSLVVPIHRGDIFGLPGQVIAAIACIALLLLTYTGVALSWHRFFRTRGRFTKA